MCFEFTSSGDELAPIELDLYNINAHKDEGKLNLPLNVNPKFMTITELGCISKYI